jgi:hypothetical protein
VNLQTVDIPRVRAREQAAEYRRAAKTISDPSRRAEFEQIARAYMIAARDESPMISLTQTITAGGTVPRTVVYSRGTEWERRETSLLPRVAACRASAAFCYCLGVQRDGQVTFSDSLRRRLDYRSGVLSLETRFPTPEGYTYASGDVHERRSAWQAMVPIVPPKHRPAGARTLDSFVVLWEVDDWQWAQVPAPPGDPALLRHVGGDIYAVLAVWDLTELERLVLAGRRPS